MQDIHQSSTYAQFMNKIGWNVENIDGVNIFIKKLPLLPAVMKLQRSDKLPQLNKLKLLMQKYHSHSISVEPNVIARSPKDDVAISNLKSLTSPFLPTKTIFIDLLPDESEIFNKFSGAKRKAVRRAQNLGVEIFHSNNIEDFIKLKGSSAGFLGFLTTQTLKPIWKTFAPNNAFILLAKINIAHYSSNSVLPNEKLLKISSRSAKQDSNNKFIAGVLILIWQNTAYYWMAATSNAGKQNFAPTLLIWESLKKAKKMNCTNFDFEGIYDERYEKLNKEWLGFSKFKSGFGGKEIYFPQSFKINL